MVALQADEHHQGSSDQRQPRVLGDQHRASWTVSLKVVAGEIDFVPAYTVWEEVEVEQVDQSAPVSVRDLDCHSKSRHIAATC